MGEQNWGGNLDYGVSGVLSPSSIDELAAIIASGPVRPLGTRHSFSPLAATNRRLVTATEIPPDFDLDESAQTVTVGAATKFGDLAVFLESHGWALANMGSLPHISIAGACATGTHGSGNANPILSSSVPAFEYLNADGERVVVKRGEPDFEICRLGLGAYGFWVRVTLDIQPSYQVRQDVYRQIAWDEWLAAPEEITGAGYSVSLFTTWVEPTISQVWVKSRMDRSAPPVKLGGVTADPKSWPGLTFDDADNLTAQGGQPGAWVDRLPHFRMDANPSAGEEIQTEYFVLREHAAAASRAIRAVAGQFIDALFWTEIRTIAGDGAALSPMRRGDSIAFHFTWRLQPEAVAKAIALVESVLAEFDAIPHWGKVHQVNQTRLAQLHPLLGLARERFDQLDPTGSFSSPYLVELGVR